MHKKVQGFAVLYDKRIKGFKKRDMIENIWGKISENLDFVENSNFIRGSTKGPVRS